MEDRMTLSFNIQGEFITRLAREWLFYEGKDIELVMNLLLSCMSGTDMKPEELKDCFPEFGSSEQRCRFTGCVHIGEPDCGVKAALERGELSESRYGNYKLLYQELKEKRRY